MTSAPSLDTSLPLPLIRRIDADHLPVRIDPLALVVAVTGDLTVVAGEERFRLRAGELLVFRSGCALRLERAAPEVRVVIFQVDPAWVAAFNGLHGEQETPAGRDLDLVPAGTTLSRRATPLFVGQRLKGGLAEERVPPATSAALLGIMREAQGSPLDPRHPHRRAGTRRESLVSAIAEYDPGADDNFSLCSLADRLGLSERQTARLIRAETGRSFRELKATARLERAQKLLASSDLPILEVALRAGWNSSSQFHEAFRSSVGVSPARFRAAHRA